MPDADPAEPPWGHWVEAVRAGDQRAARELVAALHPLVAPIVRGRLPRTWAEEDLFQEVFVKVFTKLDQYRGDVPFVHWARRVAVNTCIDALRHRRRRPELRRADLSEAQENLWDELTVDTGAVRPGDDFAARELIQALLDTLPARDRLLIEWVEVEQKSMDEIAELTGWSKLVLKVRLFRARQRLRDALEQLERKETR
ncbi:RNA polymerase sigma factor [Nibricoccus sp. IMCC34717]|uniref:RNA polymerase sigma factor n=1 Tax=Nibricoccus sp. IMCC34717 TaxID=3034021 RepID=UPI00384E4F05